MLTAARALNRAAEADPLPIIPELAQLNGYGFIPRLGQLLMIAGQPGAGKSFFALWWAVKANLPTLYFSADMDEHTALTRLASLMSGTRVDDITLAIESGGIDYYSDVLEASKVQWCFDSSPTMDDIADELSAYVEVWDRYPPIIVVDNLLNVEAEMGEDHSGLRMILKELHRMARETGAAVIALHHTREEGDPTVPQARSAIQGKVAQLPERILTVAMNPFDNCFAFAPVKNRGGQGDATGRTFFRLTADLGRATFYPHVSANLSYGGF